MTESRVVFGYCRSGPYRFVRQLVESQDSVWFPWGYRLSQLTSGAKSAARSGTTVELWEVDDTRMPTTAIPVATATIDFVTVADGYMPMTLKSSTGLSFMARESDVLNAVANGNLAFECVPKKDRQ
jgi:hypothetical protein